MPEFIPVTDPEERVPSVWAPGENSFIEIPASGGASVYGPATINDIQPVLHMHFDGDFVDAVGNTVFTPAGSYVFEASDDLDFDQTVRGISNGRVFGTSIIPLELGPTRKFTIQGKSKFTGVQNGGTLFAKNYHSSQPAPGVFKDDYSVGISRTRLAFGWSGTLVDYSTTYADMVGQNFYWAITDDGLAMRFYINGILTQTETSIAVDINPPPITPSSSISVLNKLQGFSGSSPDWSNTFYIGQVDELRVFIGDTADYALYRGASYELPTSPYEYPRPVNEVGSS